MKLKLLPIAGASLASVSIPLVSCSNNKIIRIHWNLEDGYYESKTRVLEFTDYETIDDGANAYYDFIDDNPQILADDIMFAVFDNFSSGYYVETAVGEEIASWTPYQIDLNLSDITLKQNANKTTDCYVTYSLNIKFIEMVKKLCYGELNFEVQNFKFSLLGTPGEYLEYNWWIMPEYTLHEEQEEAVEDLINDENWSYRYLFKRSIGYDWIEDYTFDSSYVKKAINNDDESAIEQMTKAFKMLQMDSYFFTNVGIEQHD